MSTKRKRRSKKRKNPKKLHGAAAAAHAQKTKRGRRRRKANPGKRHVARRHHRARKHNPRRHHASGRRRRHRAHNPRRHGRKRRKNPGMPGWASSLLALATGVATHIGVSAIPATFAPANANVKNIVGGVVGAIGTALAIWKSPLYGTAMAIGAATGTAGDKIAARVQALIAHDDVTKIAAKAKIHGLNYLDGMGAIAAENMNAIAAENMQAIAAENMAAMGPYGMGKVPGAEMGDMELAAIVEYAQG